MTNKEYAIEQFENLINTLKEDMAQYETGISDKAEAYTDCINDIIITIETKITTLKNEKV